MMSASNERTGFFSFLKGRKAHEEQLPEEIQSFFPKRISPENLIATHGETEAPAPPAPPVAPPSAVEQPAAPALEEAAVQPQAEPEAEPQAEQEPVEETSLPAKSYDVEDPLTLLPNRRAVEQRLHDALAIARRNAGLVGLIFIDINEFKQVNDNYGHQVGDAVLREIAQRMKRAARSGETIGRFGGDEFVAVYPAIRSQEELAAAANRLLRVFDDPVVVGPSQFKLSASAGAVIAPIDAETSEDLLERVDAAMYRAKNLGKTEVCWYNSEIDEELRARREFSESFGDASVLHQIFLAYQPIYDIASNEMVAAEALLRWQHPARGLLVGRDVLSIVDMLPESVERWIAAKAIATAADWKRRNADLRVSVNLSNVGESMFAALVDLLKAARLETAWLNVEIDERVFVRDRQRVAAFAESCAKVGIGITLDNFSGALSLADMNRLPISSLKLSRSVVHGLREDENARAIADVAMLLAKSQGFEAIAMGVERADEYQRLKSMGVRLMQGYAKGVPVASVDFTAWLAASTAAQNSKTHSG